MIWHDIKNNPFFQKNKKVIGFFLLGFSLLMLMSMVLNPVYKAQGKLLWIPKNKANANWRRNFYEKQEALITSRELIFNTIYFLQLKQSSEKPMTIETFKEDFALSPIKGTDIWNVTFRHQNPKIAADTLNHLLRSFIIQYYKSQVVVKDPRKEQMVRLEKQIYKLLAEKTKLLQESPDKKTEINSIRSQITSTSLQRQKLASAIQGQPGLVQKRMVEADLQMVEQAMIPTSPDYSKFMLVFVVFCAGLGGFILKECYTFDFDKMINLSHTKPAAYLSTSEIIALSPFPIFGIIPEINFPTIFTTKITGSFQNLLQHFEKNPDYMALVNRPMTSILLAHHADKETKTILATALSVSLAQAGRKVALVSLTEKPDLKHYLGVTADKGISHFLSGDLFNHILTPTEIENLTFVDKGTLTLSSIVNHPRMMLLHSQLKVYFDVVIFDIDSVEEIEGLQIFSNYIDSVLMLMSAQNLTKESATNIYSRLQESALPIAGVVIQSHETVY